MTTITTKDDRQIYYKDWGRGRPVVFSHGWPLSADACEDQMVFLASNGCRAIAHDRRGHGRSSQPWNGNEMDTYADDLAELLEAFEVRKAVLIGHSTGGGEVARCIGRHGTSRVARAVLVGAVPPLGSRPRPILARLPLEVFDDIRATTAADRSQFFKDLSTPFFGANRPGSKVAGHAQQLLAAAHDGRPEKRTRLHQGILRTRLHRRPEAVRRADTVKE